MTAYRPAYKADDFHFAVTRQLPRGNTIGGKVRPLDYQRQACILVAAGRISLEQGPRRLFEDHKNAVYLSAGLAGG